MGQINIGFGIKVLKFFPDSVTCVNYIIILSLGFFIWKLGIIIYLLNRAIMKMKRDNLYEGLCIVYVI